MSPIRVARRNQNALSPTSLMTCGRADFVADASLFRWPTVRSFRWSESQSAQNAAVETVSPPPRESIEQPAMATDIQRT
jgi:hypothetical protein